MADLYCVCKECSREFYIKQADQEWFAKQGYELPKRCHACRKKRKAEKESQLGVRTYDSKKDASSADKKSEEYADAWASPTKG